MATYHLTLDDPEAHAWEAYLAWHQAQPEGSLARLVPHNADSVPDLLLACLEGPRAALQRWMATHHPEGSPESGQ